MAKFNQEQFDFIINHINEGNSLRSALLEPKTPSSATFYDWLKDSEREKRYTCACEARADLIFEDILSIADKQDADICIDSEGREITNHNVIQRARLQVDARKWMLGKMNPKKYSDKSNVDLTTNGESINQAFVIERTIKDEVIPKAD